MVTFDTPDGPTDAIIARPADAASDHPGVLLFMDAIGLRPQIESMAQRIADWGYVVLAPNLFHRLGSAADLAPTADLRAPGEREAFLKRAMPRVRTLTLERLRTDVDASIAALHAQPGVADGPIGVVGYCMGARVAVRAACWHPDAVAACAGFHGGGLATDADDSPHLGLASARARFAFGHADKDKSMGPSAVTRLGDALTAAGLDATNEVYAAAPHGYSMADTSSYDEGGAERSFAELRTLIDETIGVRSALRQP